MAKTKTAVQSGEDAPAMEAGNALLESLDPSGEIRELTQSEQVDILTDAVNEANAAGYAESLQRQATVSEIRAELDCIVAADTHKQRMAIASRISEILTRI